MILSLLVPILISQANEPDKSVVWVVTEAQRSLDYGSISNPDLTAKEIIEELGISFTKFTEEDTVIFISEDAYPLTSYKETIRWVNNSISGLTSFFDPRSENGSKLLDFIQTRSFTSSFEAPEGSKPIGIGLGVTIKNPIDANGAPFMKLVDHPDAEKTGIATVKPFSGTDEEVKQKAREMRGKPSLFPNQRNRLEISILQFEGDKRIPLRSNALFNVSNVQAKLSHELLGLESALAKEIESAISRLAASCIDGFDELKSNMPISLNKLPKNLREDYEKNFINSYEWYGFASKADAEAYLATNPKLDISFSLTAFQFSRYPGATGGPINALGLYIKP